VGEEGEAGPPLPPVAVGEARLGEEMLGSRTGCGFAGEVMRCRGGDTEGGDTGGGGDRRPRWPSGMGGLRKWSLVRVRVRLRLRVRIGVGVSFR